MLATGERYCGGMRYPPRASVSNAANSTVVRSAPCGPIAWMPMGRPAALVVMGIVVAGAPAMLANALHLVWSQYERANTVDVDGAAEAVMVLVVMIGCCGGCHGQQQHVELLEEPHPAVRDLPTSRIAEQPRPVALDRPPQRGGSVAARTHQ